MQAQTPTPNGSGKANKNRLDKPGIILCCLLLLVGLVAAFHAYSLFPSSDWRYSETAFPWKDSHATVEHAQGSWKSSQGHARLQLRTAYYPELELQMGQLKGSGRLIIKFFNSQSEQRGDTLVLFYADGVFRPVNNDFIQAEGNKARVLIENGFVSQTEYRLHQLHEDEPLWRICIWNHPDGAQDERFLGYCSIPATDLAS